MNKNPAATGPTYIRFDAINVGALLSDINGSAKWLVTDVTSTDGEYIITTMALYEADEDGDPMTGYGNSETKGWNAAP